MSSPSGRIKVDDASGFPVLMADDPSAAKKPLQRAVMIDGTAYPVPPGVDPHALLPEGYQFADERERSADDRPQWSDEEGRYVLAFAEPEVGATTTAIEGDKVQDTTGLTPLREATRRCRDVIGNLPLVKVDGVNYVSTKELEAFEGRGNRVHGMGAGERIEREIKQSTADRAKAFASQQRRRASDAARRRAGR